MPFPLAIPLALSAINALIRFRGRLDTILALSAATEGLPFLLPPAPSWSVAYRKQMLRFFATEQGQLLLTLRGLQADWDTFRDDANALLARDRLFEIYKQLPEVTIGTAPDEITRKGPSTDLRLAYFIVESHRLSRNPVVTRVLLAAADTLLEFGGENAGTLIRNPKLAGLVGTLLNRFAGDADWDDEPGEIIFRRLLGSVASALVENRGVLPDNPAVQLLLDALADVRDALNKAAPESGTDFVAGFASRAGFDLLVSRLLIRAADTPEVLPDNEAARKVVAGLIREVGEHWTDIREDPKALAGVLQAGLAIAAGVAGEEIAKKFADESLASVVLGALVKEVQLRAGAATLFADVAQGEFWAALYKTALHAAVSNTELLADAAGLEGLAAKLVTGLASALGNTSPAKLLTRETLRKLVTQTLEILAAEPNLIGSDQEFAGRILQSVLAATSAAAKDGLSASDVLEIANAAVRSAASNVALVNLGNKLNVVLAGLAPLLAAKGIGAILTTSGRKELFLAGLNTVTTNPASWGRWADANPALVEAVVSAVSLGLSGSAAEAFSSATLIKVARVALTTSALYGQQFITKKIKTEALTDLLQMVLTRAASGEQAIDGESLPEAVRSALIVLFEGTATPLAETLRGKAIANKVSRGTRKAARPKGS